MKRVETRPDDNLRRDLVVEEGPGYEIILMPQLTAEDAPKSPERERRLRRQHAENKKWAAGFHARMSAA